MADGAGTTTWTYDTLYRPTQIAATFGTVSYGYDRLGLRLSLVYPSAKEADTAYDGLNRPNTITPVGSGSWVAGNTTYTYKAFGAPATAVRPNCVTTPYNYRHD